MKDEPLRYDVKVTMAWFLWWFVRFHRLSFVMIFVFFAVDTSMAVIDLAVIHPATEFTTNNQTLQVEGTVESSVPAEIIVSINTPAGVQSLAPLEHSIYGIVMDVGALQALKGVLIRPVTAGEFPRGPRLMRLAFSQGESNFPSGQHFNVPSSIDSVRQRTVVHFPSIVSARFVQIEMLEGWQIGPIAIESIEFFDTSDQIVQARVQSISILLDLTERRRAAYSIELLLREGENQLSLLARTLSPSLLDPPEAVDRETISVFYLPELRPEAADEGRFVLSDGRQAEVVLPVDAFDEKIKKLQFFSVPPDQVPPLSYLRNIRIVKGTAPVVVYRFEALQQGAFAAEATHALPNQPPTLVTDGILEPPSTWMAGLVPLPVNLTIDLGVRRTISRMKVHANVVDSTSFGPISANILTSNNNEDFIEILEVTSFEERTTTIELPTLPSARYFRLEITKSKQANNLQLNEIEFFDVTGVKIVPFETFEHLTLQRPIFLELSYDASDLAAANITREEDLRVFAWDALAREWQWVGGVIDLNQRTVRLELNYISQIALFQAVPSELQMVWSFNPFSPDGNGIADITRLTIANLDVSQLGQTELVVEIFDLHSRLVRTLINRTVINANAVSIEWDGRNQTGEVVRIGPYIYQVRLASEVRNGVIVVGK